MIPSDHFVRFYNEVFKFLEERGEDALENYWLTISKHQERELLPLFRAKGYAGMKEYWDRIAFEENCDLDTTADADHFEFRMLAVEYLLAARDWPAVRQHAAALAAYTREEPLPWSDLVIARAEALAAAGKATRRKVNVGRLQELLQQAERMGFVALLPGLRDALQRSA